MINNFMMWIWLGVVVICIVIELLTTSLTTIWFALSGILMIFLSKTGMELQWQILIFIAVACILLVVTRPLLMKKIKIHKTNVNSLEGQEVLILKTASKFQKGEAKTKNGVIWNCVSETEEEIPEGATGTVTKVDGNTLIIVSEKKIGDL